MDCALSPPHTLCFVIPRSLDPIFFFYFSAEWKGSAALVVNYREDGLRVVFCACGGVPSCSRVRIDTLLWAFPPWNHQPPWGTVPLRIAQEPQ